MEGGSREPSPLCRRSAQEPRASQASRRGCDFPHDAGPISFMDAEWRAAWAAPGDSGPPGAVVGSLPAWLSGGVTKGIRRASQALAVWRLPQEPGGCSFAGNE